ncbi:2-oxoglutarate-Fe(II) type oxidoreductase hxnY-like [Vigna umbellata]|uniref:2-oxoglutarate-Fe(II) type oxidoreductase hxnY-like n=1 Tax=Vigna umbellata TaxID=87088 RepID=UPI001F5EE954|nr:2-oxoglutarate-Fe(II) type oxidoreductase hxnY-like [Vigna umbellata]XP_047180933.1 2-oxoglutarate-Fe(II) type oxidoreductase hxnY-like [Vigna umbellata]XP_047180940.1 2-oxoglutarate-Fe(II) type oxidoreductase hxnY-like [Vigna umbellata]
MAASLPIIDLSSPHRLSAADSVRQACVEYGFFYLVNHGVDTQCLRKVFNQSAHFFSLPLQQKMDLARKEYRGYTPLYSETLHVTSLSKGDPKESYYIGPVEDPSIAHLNQWPSEELLPNWKPSMESLYWKLLAAGKNLLSLIAMSLNLDEDYFEKIGALNKPAAFLRLLHYPGELVSGEQICGASPHSDYGMVTLLMTDGVPGLQISKDKLREPQVWEDVPHVEGALIVNIGDLMERWTNCLYRSTLHRVMSTGKERYSVAFFFDPSSDCMVECFESCCSESSPPRFPPIRSGDYLNERFRLTYGSERELQCSTST